MLAISCFTLSSKGVRPASPIRFNSSILLFISTVLMSFPSFSGGGESSLTDRSS